MSIDDKIGWTLAGVLALLVVVVLLCDPALAGVKGGLKTYDQSTNTLTTALTGNAIAPGFAICDGWIANDDADQPMYFSFGDTTPGAAPATCANDDTDAVTVKGGETHDLSGHFSPDANAANGVPSVICVSKGASHDGNFRLVVQGCQ